MPNTVTSSTIPFATANTTATAAQFNAAVSLVRGDIIPIDGSLTAAADLFYDLGTTDHRWNQVYTNQVMFSNVTTAGNLIEGRADGKGFNFVIGGLTITSMDSAGLGGGTGINHIDNDDAEADTSGWATYADAATTTGIPVDGTGGSPTVTWTRTTSTPLRGTGSFLLTKDAANRQNEGASYAFTIDDADKFKVLAVTFDYEIASGTYATADLEVYVYDVTNSVMYQLAGHEIQNTGVENRFIGTFQTTSSTSYRLIVNVASTSASAYTVKIDNIQVGPQTVQYGAPITEWNESWTPVASWTTNTTPTGKWRRVGDSMECVVNLELAGAPDNVSLTITLPGGYTIDTAKWLNGTQFENRVGHGVLVDGGSNYYDANIAFNSTSGVVVLASNASGSYALASALSQTVPFTWASGDSVHVWFRVPITGWGSSVVMSDSSDTRVVEASYSRGSAQSINDSTTTTILFATLITDTHSAFNTGTGEYTVKVPGKYRVSAICEFAANATGARVLYLYKNGVEQRAFGYAGDNIAGDSTMLSGSLNISCVAGDVLTIRARQTSGGALNIAPSGTNFTHFSLNLISGPSAIAASEKIVAMVSGDAASAASGNPIIFPTKDYDTHGAYNATTGQFTAPAPDFYRVHGSITSANANVAVTVYINAVANRTCGYTDASGEGVFSCIVYALAGQTIDLRPNNTLDAASGSQMNIERVK